MQVCPMLVILISIIVAVYLTAFLAEIDIPEILSLEQKI